MDNVTHTLIGLAVAEGALALGRARSGREADVQTTRAAWIASALGNNVADLDVVLSGLDVAPLGYLLHHRGHTHTLIATPLLALLPFAVAWLFDRRAKTPPPSEAPWRAGWPRVAWLYGLAWLGTLTHIAMDALNDYGVHALWPFDPRWSFGDTLFIVEPLLWVTLAALLFGSTRARWGRVALGLIMLSAIVLGVVSGFMLPLFVAALGALAPLLLYAGSRASRSTRAALAITAGALVIIAFGLGSASARARASEVLEASHPDATLVDLALHPAPGNPFCWGGLAIEREGDVLRYEHVAVSTIPRWVSAEGCRLPAPRDASSLTPAPRHAGRVDVQLLGSHEGSIAALRRARESRCRAEAYLRFSRAPLLFEGLHGPFALDDARYRTLEGPSWSRLALDPEHAEGCSELTPSWQPPRLDLLE